MSGVGAYLLVVANQAPAKSVKELIAYVKANPQKLSYASTGLGGGSHLTAVSTRAFGISPDCAAYGLAHSKPPPSRQAVALECRITSTPTVGDPGSHTALA